MISILFPVLTPPWSSSSELGLGEPLSLGHADPHSASGGGNRGDCKGRLDSSNAFITSLSLLPLLSRASRPEGLQGLLAATGRGLLAQPHLLPGTSFPPEEAAAAKAAAAAAAAAPALRVYIFFTKSSGIVNVFFKIHGRKEPCIICKQCTIGHVVQSLLYSSLSGFCHQKCLRTPHPTPVYTKAVSHLLHPSQTVIKAPLVLLASSLQMHSPLPAALTPLSSLLIPAPTTLLNTGAPWSSLGCCPPLALTPALLSPGGLPGPSLCPQL